MNDNDFATFGFRNTAIFKRTNFLQEAIESVVQQQYQNWELLLIDDGSSDNSTGIANTYSEKYPGKVIYVEHEVTCKQRIKRKSKRRHQEKQRVNSLPL